MKWVVLALVAVGWLWELYAFATGRLPTITHTIHQHRDRTWVALGVMTFNGLLYHHLLIAGR